MTEFSVRPARLPQEYAAIAAVLEAENPGWAPTAEELAHEDGGRDPQYHHATFVAEARDGEQPVLVGVAQTGHEPLAHRPDKFLINLRVDPAWQGRGVGKALYAAILTHLAPFAPGELCADVWQAHPRAARFLTERGFVEFWRRIDFTLEVAGFDFAPYAGLAEKLQSQGITIQSYEQLGHDPDRLVKLYELDWALWQDIPYFGQTIVKRPLAQFVADEIEHPKFLAEACFVAVRDGEFLGYSNLSRANNGLNIEMTGVRRSARGQGVATLLKLATIRYAQAQGNLPLWTVNDSVNQAIIALNQKFGFQACGAMVRYSKRLAARVALDAKG
jgi:mycothiol synthase